MPLVYAGIDEAGYGPMLGPLCVGATVFIVDDHDAGAGAPDLWNRLDGAVCRKRRDPRHRIAVDDSKKLKGAKSTRTHPLTHLERGVLTFLATIDIDPADDAALLADLAPATPSEPWYETTTPLPLAQDHGHLRIASARLRRAMDEAGVHLAMMRCEVIDAGDFNDQVGRTGSKAVVNFSAAMRQADAVWSRWPADHPRLIVDRHGGRTHYREDLALNWPDARIRIVAETDGISRYHLERDGSELTISFLKEAEDGHLPVALASMVAKYVRELHMIRMNRYFQGHLPELKATAGYVADARRYLEEIGPLVERLGLSRPALVRRV